MPDVAHDDTAEDVLPPAAPSDRDRRAALEGAIQTWVRQGYRVESQGEFQAVVSKGQRPNHTLHLWLSVFTLSLWFWFVWLPILMFHKIKRRQIMVDAAGNIRTQKV